MPVFRYLDLSTAHLTEAEMCAVEADFPALDDAGPRVIVHEYGAWVNVASDPEAVEPPDFAEHYPNVIACLRRARELDCEWINFDRDAQADEALPTYNW